MRTNFKFYLLNLIFSASLSVLLATTFTATTHAQISIISSSSVKDRVSQLERISNAHSQLLTYFQQQIADNQHDIDSLRGQIQENQHLLSQIIKRQQQIHQQIDRISSKSHNSSANG
ncbi:MAG: YbgF trimerization domain-containing protein [Sodalis sp. (in: enterobacteria)]